jgi:glutamate racemase
MTISGFGKTSTIGLVDSGVGMITVAKALKCVFHDYNLRIIGVGDRKNFPYGSRKGTENIKSIQGWTARIIRHLANNMGADHVIVACHTASAYLAPTFSEISRTLGKTVEGIIGAGSLEATSKSKTKKIGVLSSLLTKESGAYERTIKSFCPDAEVFTHACTDWVKIVEEGKSSMTTEELRKVVKADIDKLIEQCPEIDTLVLGCTHFPFLRQTINYVTDYKYHIIDPALSLANRIFEMCQRARRLKKGKLTIELYFTAKLPEDTRHLISNYLEEPVTCQQIDIAESTWKEILTDWKNWWKLTE